MERATSFRHTERNGHDNDAIYGGKRSTPDVADTGTDTEPAASGGKSTDEYPDEWEHYAATDEPATAKQTPEQRLLSGANQIDALGNMFGMVFQQLSQIPANRRTAQWPPINGVPAGQHWLLADDEALRLGDAWARVLVAYVPMEYLAGTGVVGSALSMTAVMVFVRVQQDAYIAQLVAQAEANARETLRQQTQPGPGPIPMGEPQREDNPTPHASV